MIQHKEYKSQKSTLLMLDFPNLHTDLLAINNSRKLKGKRVWESLKICLKKLHTQQDSTWIKLDQKYG